MSAGISRRLTLIGKGARCRGRGSLAGTGRGSAAWSRRAASGFVVGLDGGMPADHCALVLAGVWPLAPPTIGIVDVKQFPLGTPLEEVADEVAQAVRENRAKAVVDSTNNSAFVGMLAARPPRPAVNHLVAAAITGAITHAAQ